MESWGATKTDSTKNEPLKILIMKLNHPAYSLEATVCCPCTESNRLDAASHSQHPHLWPNTEAVVVFIPFTAFFFFLLFTYIISCSPLRISKKCSLLLCCELHTMINPITLFCVSKYPTIGQSHEVAPNEPG